MKLRTVELRIVKRDFDDWKNSQVDCQLERNCRQKCVAYVRVHVNVIEGARIWSLENQETESLMKTFTHKKSGSTEDFEFLARMSCRSGLSLEQAPFRPVGFEILGMTVGLQGSVKLGFDRKKD